MASKARTKIYTHLWYAKEAEEYWNALVEGGGKPQALDIATLQKAYRG